MSHLSAISSVKQVNRSGLPVKITTFEDGATAEEYKVGASRVLDRYDAQHHKVLTSIRFFDDSKCVVRYATNGMVACIERLDAHNKLISYDYHDKSVTPMCVEAKSR